MSIDKFFVREVRVTHPVLVASYGPGLVPDHDTGTTTTVRGWLYQLSGSEQQTATRDAEVSTHVLRLPADAEIHFGDTVEIDGQRFTVDAPPSRVWRPGGQHHVRASLLYVDG